MRDGAWLNEVRRPWSPRCRPFTALGPPDASQRPTDEEVTDLIQRFDVNGDGELEISEWLEMAAILFLGADDSEIVNEMFKVRGDPALAL